MVCRNVAKVTQMCHDNLANALRLQSAAELRKRGLAGKKGTVACQRWGAIDIVAVLPRLKLTEVHQVSAVLTYETCCSVHPSLPPES